jgi:hypothetical protein
MLFIIPCDVLNRLAIKYLTFSEIIMLKKTCRTLYTSFDEVFFKQLAFDWYGAEFWEFAKKRPPHTSLPLNSYTEEMNRIEKFQRALSVHDDPRWEPVQFYSFWKKVDNQHRVGRRFRSEP